jgi:TonB family protein
MARVACVCVFFVAGLLAGAPAFAQESLQTAKNLYASAAYEDALGVLGRLPNGSGAEVEQYRVFCLIALGRSEEAARAIKSVLSADPMYVPDTSDVPPRILEVFGRVRRELLPGIALGMYTNAKAALERKARADAIAGFEAVVRLIDTGFSNDDTISELRLLAAGFLDLSRALPAPGSPEPVRATNSTSPAPAAPSAPQITQPTAIRQALPAWSPPDALSRQAAYNGAIRVKVTAAGRVESAEIVAPVHPVYDRALLHAARTWEYQPARYNGLAVASEVVVQVHLKPR